MYARRPFGSPPSGGGAFLFRRPPRDIAILLGVLFVTFSLQFFSGPLSQIVALLRLGPQVWQSGFLWQLVTYPFTGFGPPSAWFLLELLMVYWFGSDVYRRTGRKGFWQLVLTAVILAAVVAVITALVGTRFGAGWSLFYLLQGQRTLLAILVCAFACLNRHAVIYLFFVLPIKAAWFVPLELVLAFIAYLSTKELSGLLGLWTAIGVTYALLTPGGPRQALRNLSLRSQRLLARLRLGWLRKRRGIRVVKDDRSDVRKGPWVH